MDVLDKKPTAELLAVLLQEIAKAQNEIKCARGDIEKASNRVKFATVLVHKLIEREETQR